MLGDTAQEVGDIRSSRRLEKVKTKGMTYLYSTCMCADTCTRDSWLKISVVFFTTELHVHVYMY